MSSKRTRFISFPRFSKTNLQKVLSSKSRRRSIAEIYGYESLEARQLLTADIGLSFPTVNDGSALNSSANPPNVTAAVGENHIVQFVNDGYAIYNKADGSLATQQPGGVAPTGDLTEFFTFASQGVGIAQDPVGLLGNNTPDDQLRLVQPRLVFDSGFDRWYVTALSNEDFNGSIPGIQASRVYLAASVTSDPTGNWKSTRLQLTSPTLITGELDRNVSSVNLSIDEVSLTITARQPHPSEIVTVTVPDVDTGEPTDVNVLLGFGNGANPRLPFSPAQVLASIPQVALFGGDIELNRFEIIEGIRQDPDDDFNIDVTGLTTADIIAAPDPFNLYPVDGEADLVGAGYDLQVGFDSTISPQQFPVTSKASMWTLAINSDPDGSGNPTPDNSSQGMQISLTEWLRPGLPDGSSQNVELNLEQGDTTLIDVPFFRMPDVVRQPGDIIRDRSQTLFNATVVQEGDFLYAVHSVRGGADDLGANSTLRWYKVNVDTGELIQTDRIELDEDTDLFNPSIDVGENGTVAIGYTVSGLGADQFPSSFVSLGVPSEGNNPFSPLVFNDPTLLKAGESVYIDELTGGSFENQFWGRYTTTYNDPYDPNSFWTFQQYTDADNNWAVQATQVGPTDTTPVIQPDIDLDNVIEVNQVGDNIEVIIDGTLVGTYDSDGIGTLTVNGNGGFDQFIVNVDDLDAPEISGSYILVGDGNDTFQSNAISNTSWVFDGADGANINNGRILVSGMIEFHSGAGDDRFEFPTSDYNFPVLAGDGNDTFVLAQDMTGNLQLLGEIGDDDYRVPTSSFVGITISDSLMAENDNLTTSGTDGDDTINVGPTSVTLNGVEITFDDALSLWGIETFEIDGLDGDDTFNITSTTQGVSLFGQRGADIFNVDETSVMAGASALMIDGGTGNNSLSVSQNDALPALNVMVDESLITNMTSAEISFIATGGTFSETATSTGITLIGSDTRADVMEIVGVAADNDLSALGRAFDDRFIFENSINGAAELLGGVGNDRYITSLDSIFDVVVTDTVAAEADVLYVGLTEGDDVINVDASGYLFNGLAYPTADATFNGIEDFTIDGLGGVDTFDITRTTTVANFFGSDGDDVFNVTDLTLTGGTAEINLFGGEDNNTLNVVRNESSGGTVLVNESSVEGMTLAKINFTAARGFFNLVELTGSSAADNIVVETLLPSTMLIVKGQDGDDRLDVQAAAEGNVELEGGMGDDNFLVALGGGFDRTVTVNEAAADEGFDRLDVFFSDAAETINLTTGLPGERQAYAIGSNSVDYDPAVLEALALHSLGGDDRFNVTSTTMEELILAGGDGDDTYDIANIFGGTALSVIDSVDAENDQLTVDGTSDADTFEINENSFLINGNVFIADDATSGNIVGIESFEVNALDGDDTFIVNSATRGFNLLGGDGDDSFMINDTASDGGANDLFIDGGTGANSMDIQRIAGTPEFAVVQETYIQNVANSMIRYSSTGGSFTGGNGGITIRGLDDVNDSYLVFGLLAENSLELLGGGGNDYHRITENVQGDVWMDGALGRDRYVFFLDETKSRSHRIADSGNDGQTDRINAFLGQNSDVVVLDGTEIALINDRMSFAPTIETVEILAGDGDDRIEVRQFDGVRFLRIKGQDGNDVFTVNRAQGVENVILIGEAGNDTFNLAAATQTGFLSASGNDGEDFFLVADDFYRNASINGGNDNDRYDISFADRGRRSLTVADSGVGGNDTATIRASDASTQLTLRASGINSPFQLIGTTRQIESLDLIGTEARDIVTMFSVPVVNMTIDTLTGSDILNINSNNGAENLNIDLGAEQDVANIVATAPGTTTTLDLGRDDDLVNLGSFLAADSGNLDALQGALNIELGQGSDRLYINDSQSSGAHGYRLTGSQVINDPSVRDRNFSGINYSGAEFLQMRSNAQFNQFTVTPSSTVKYLLDGNLPQTNRLTITGSNDGREMFSSGDFSGIWTFDSLRDIQFEQFAI